MPNTTYEYYVRTVCGKDDYSDWTGPYVFTTICSTFEVPYWEGFNSDTKSLDCWTIIDIDDDGDEYNGRWNIDSYRPFEGDGLISFTSYDGDQTDDWLISPSINFKAGKLYRLKYNYKSSANNASSEFTVLASNSGLDIDKFTKEIVTKQKYTNSTYLEKTVFIDNYSGSVNFAWYVQGTDAKDFSIDNVFVEEVIGCPEPIDLNIDNIASESVEISWRDDFKASKWQYYIQKVGNSKPDNKTKGKEITSKINNKFSIDALGNKLEGNTDYEFYVRTDCGDGTFSIWTGPFNFTTLCGVYETPYWEGFNLDDLGYRCWDFQKYDGSKSYYAWNIYGGLAYEGSGSIRYYKVDDKNKPGEFPSDAWAISPAIKLTPDTYVLKYNYLTDGKYDNEFEVRLSSTDRNPNSFTNILVPKATYTNSEYKENVVFFTGVASEVFVGWHATSEKTSYIYIDNITLKKVNGCQEPYYVVVENNKSDGFDLSWQQNGGITTWEVIVVKHGEDSNANPIVTKTVTGTPNTTINGLGSGELYTIYVRSKCSPAGDTFSDWSTSVNGFTKVGANDECSGAINIPVNESKECGEYVNATLFGATTSSTVLPSCNGAITNDIWFEFTAKTSVHSLSISDFTSLSSSTPTLEFAMYDKSCGAITNTALECFTLSSFDTSKVFKGLIPGQKYYFRIGVRKDKNIDVNFNLCITSPSFLNISESGNEYTVEELVKNVLVDSNCDLISNISWISGDQFKNDNSIGYFVQNSSDFVFNNGIVLSTNGVKYGMGPGDDFNEGNDTDEWVGDVDLESLLVANNRDPYSVNATVLEFDFIPIVDSLKFDFIFASNEYGSHQCDFSDVFAFFLTDLTSGEVINLAVVPGTDVPISVTTIKDMKYNRGCASSNVEYFDKFYGANGLPEYENPINYKGMTVPLTAKSAVIPGRKYHIKMAIADYMDNQVNSAVFLKGGSFNLGNLDLGEDLLVETGNALCSEEVRIIKSGLSFSDEFKMEISWYRDGILIPDSNQVDLEVKESGVYEIEVNYPELNCLSVGSIKIEMYPAISDEVYQAKPIIVCRQSIEDILVDLTSVEAEMFKDANKESYSTSYYTSKEDAKLLKNEIADKENYSLGKNILNQSVYIRIENLITGCFEVFEVKIEAKQGEFPGQFENILVCSEYIFPELEENQHYFSESSGLGYEYLAGDALITPGEHTIYVLQINSDDGCYEETSYVVKITEKVVADVFPDLELDCEVHILQPLSKYNKYFTKAGGEGEELVVGSFITDSQMIYVYALSEDGVCFDESSYMVSYEECPIQKGISPNGDGINDSFDLSNHNVTSLKVYNRYGSEVYNSKGNYTNQWVGQNKEGNMLADGTYYYVAVSHGQIRTGWVQINR